MRTAFTAIMFGVVVSATVVWLWKMFDEDQPFKGM